MTVEHQRIKQLLPHRYPIALVDWVVEFELGKSLLARKAVSGSEPCYQGVPNTAAPSELAYPRTLMIESFCQAAGLLWALGNPVGDDVVMLFGGMGEVEFLSEVFPGDVMEHAVLLDKVISDAAVFSGEIRVGNHTVARIGNVMVALRPAVDS